MSCMHAHEKAACTYEGLVDGFHLLLIYCSYSFLFCRPGVNKP